MDGDGLRQCRRQLGQSQSRLRKASGRLREFLSYLPAFVFLDAARQRLKLARGKRTDDGRRLDTYCGDDRRDVGRRVVFVRWSVSKNRFLDGEVAVSRTLQQRDDGVSSGRFIRKYGETRVSADGAAGVRESPFGDISRVAIAPGSRTTLSDPLLPVRILVDDH